MSHDIDRRCPCMAEHRPAPLELERHHVWPLYLGGPDDDTNTAFVCPTTHTNVHELLRVMVKEHRAIPYAEFAAAYEQPVNRYAHVLACEGYGRWKDGVT